MTSRYSNLHLLQSFAVVKVAAPGWRKVIADRAVSLPIQPLVPRMWLYALSSAWILRHAQRAANGAGRNAGCAHRAGRVCATPQVAHRCASCASHYRGAHRSAGCARCTIKCVGCVGCGSVRRSIGGAGRTGAKPPDLRDILSGM